MATKKKKKVKPAKAKKKVKPAKAKKKVKPAKAKKKVKHVKKEKPKSKPGKGKAKKAANKRKHTKPKSRAKRRKVTKSRTKQSKPIVRGSRLSGESKRGRKAAEQALQFELHAEQDKRERRNKRRRELWAAKPESEKEAIRAKRRQRYAERKRTLRIPERLTRDIRPVRKRIEVKYMKVGDIDYLDNQPQIEDSRYNLTSHFNRTTPNEVTIPEVFEKAFQGKLKHSQLEADEISIYKYGIVIRPGLGKVTSEIEQQIMSIMEAYNIDATLIVVHESNSVDSLHIKLGNSYDPQLAGDVKNELIKHGNIFQEVWDYLDSEWDDMVWLAEWDVDEMMGGS